MKFDKNPKKSSKQADNNRNIPNFQLPPAPLNLQIPKHIFGGPEEDSQSRSNTPIGNPMIYMSSPTSQNLSYTTQSPSYYHESNLDWGEPSFGLDIDLLDDNTPQSNTNSSKITATLSNKTVDQVHSSIPMVYGERSESNLIDSNQSETQKTTPILSDGTQKYKYENLEEVLIDWINSLNVKPATKMSYKKDLVKVIKILDSKGIYIYSEVEVSGYCDEYMKNCGDRRIGDFKSTLKRFLDWVQRLRIYDKIRPKDDINNNVFTHKCESQVSAHIVGKSLSKFFNEWSISLQNGANLNALYKAQMLDFILFLTSIKTLQPTKQDMMNFFNGKLTIRRSKISKEYRQAIKSFLQFIERQGLPQNPEIYDLLDDDIKMKKTY